MPRTLQFRRLPAATLANTTGAPGELIVNSNNYTITVHDGNLPGGYATLNSATDNNIDQIARNTANTASNNITVLQGVNLTQNTNITNATNLAQAAYNYANTIVSDTQIDPVARATANTASNNIVILEGVNLTQNTNITNATNLAQAAFDQANTGGAITGNISIASTNSAINFVPNSSGDGQGYSTIELVPDTTTSSDQRIIIDPTVPSHIHIRAGGTQDDSQAQLFLGGENSNFSVGTGANPPVYITANNNSWTFNTDGETSFPGLINATGVVLSGQASLTGVSEAYSGINNATGVVAHDCSNGYIFNHTSITNNFTANFTNLTLDNGRATTITLVLNQGATPYIANAIQINSVSQTIKWSANTIPTGNVNAVDVQSFSILNVGGNYTVLGQLSTFG